MNIKFVACLFVGHHWRYVGGIVPNRCMHCRRCDALAAERRKKPDGVWSDIDRNTMPRRRIGDYKPPPANDDDFKNP